MAVDAAKLFILLGILTAVANANPDAKRLYDDLLSHYNRLIRPVSNNSEVVTVRLGLHLSQLIDLVRTTTNHFDLLLLLCVSYVVNKRVCNQQFYRSKKKNLFYCVHTRTWWVCLFRRVCVVSRPDISMNTHTLSTWERKRKESWLTCNTQKGIDSLLITAAAARDRSAEAYFQRRQRKM